MHVVVDALSSLSGGARTSLRATLPLWAADPGLHVTVVCRRAQRDGFGLAGGGSGLDVVEAPSWVTPLPARLAYSLGVVPALCRRLGADVLFCPTDHAPPAARCAVTMMIRNPTPYVRAGATVTSFARRRREEAMRAVTLAGAWASERVILVSESARAATSAVISLPLDRVRVVHHGRDGRFVPPPEGQPRAPDLLLAVSSIYTFKNYPTLLEALVLLRDQDGLRPRCKIAGADFDAEHGRFLRRQAGALALTDQVEFLGEVPHADLVALYQQATVFVMPSRLETFGHPYVEAMACGVPSVVGDIPCAREMCGDAVAYFPPESPRALWQELRRLLLDGEAREALGRRGPAQAARFSWERCARETAAVLREAVACRGARRG
jgi:glycosyltransferase involved in cell wall biosynthesis